MPATSTSTRCTATAASARPPPPAPRARPAWTSSRSPTTTTPRTSSRRPTRRGCWRSRAEEVTTPGGHANVWGLRGWRGEIDFRLAGVGSSDWHRAPAPLGRAGVRVRAEELSTQAILAAIRAGRVVVMGDARTPPPILTVRAGNATAGIGDTLRLRADEVFDVEVVAADPAFAKSRVTLAATAGPPARRRFLPASPPASRASAPPSTWRRDPRRGRRAARPHQPRVRRRRESRSSVTHPTT